jgi:hypothetical protein
MTLVKLFESSHVALGCLLRQLIICRLRCLGFGCGHVTRLGQAFGRYFTTSCLCWHDFTLPRVSREQHCFLRMTAWGFAVRRPSTLNAAVMRRFLRVVALPDLKILIFPAESIAFVRLSCRIRHRHCADKRNRSYRTYRTYLSRPVGPIEGTIAHCF